MGKDLGYVKGILLLVAVWQKLGSCRVHLEETLPGKIASFQSMSYQKIFKSKMNELVVNQLCTLIFIYMLVSTVMRVKTSHVFGTPSFDMSEFIPCSQFTSIQVSARLQCRLNSHWKNYILLHTVHHKSQLPIKQVGSTIRKRQKYSTSQIFLQKRCFHLANNYV